MRWPDPSAAREREDRWFGLHRKTRPPVEWADGRPFVRVDDGITDADRERVSAHQHGRALLHRVAQARGPTVEDIAGIDHWLRSS